MQIDNHKIFEIDNNLKELTNNITNITPYQALGKITKSKEICGHKLEDPDALVAEELSDVKNLFVECIRLSYINHIPLELGPDQIWLAIMQGFAIHVKKNSQKLKHMFVNQKEKKELRVTSDEFDLFKIDWEAITRDFSKPINENVGNDYFNLCVPKFSTTKPEFATAFEINILGTTQKYFKFALGDGCGIPKIHLLGTQQDWDELRARANTLRQYHLEDWINHLLPVLDKIIHLFKTGEVDLVFWNDIYHYRDGGGSGSSAVFGWITLFFPYTREEQNRNKPDTNKMFDFKKLPINNYKDYEIDPNFIPYGVTDAPIQFVNFVTREITRLTFKSGFFGISRVNGYLKPAVGWLIIPESSKTMKQQWGAKEHPTMNQKQEMKQPKTTVELVPKEVKKKK